MRLDQFVQQALGVSRREAQRLIRSGAIDCNGEPIRQGRQKIDPQQDLILYEGEPLSYADPSTYLLLHKPAGYVSSHRDDGYPSVFRLLDHRPDGLHIAGRLDADTTGLLLLTTDGQFSHHLTHPKRAIPKYYRVHLAEPLHIDAIAALENGVELRGDEEKTLPASVVVHRADLVDLVIEEGRYHQVKRMMAAVGNRVIQLHRYQIGDLNLEGLLEGEYRSLTAGEIESFYE